MSCWYEIGCSLYTPNCTKTCHRYLQMRHLIDTCGMPNADRYIKPLCPQKVDLEAYKRLQNIKDNIVTFVENGDNLYIVSENFGNGKTTWSLKLLYKYFDEIWCGNNFKTRGYFIHVPTLMLEAGINGGFNATTEHKHLTKILQSVDLVVWDDIGSTGLNKDGFNRLTSFIDQRNLNGKSNIYTGNLLSDELKDAVGGRLHNRIWCSSEVVQFVGVGRRESNDSNNTSHK